MDSKLVVLTLQLFTFIWLILIVASVTFEFGKYVYGNRVTKVGAIKNFFNHLHYLLFGTLNI